VRITARPALGLALSVTIAVAVTWTGEGIAFFSPYPIGFWVTTVAYAGFLLAAAYRALADARGRRRPTRSMPRPSRARAAVGRPE
jgi:zinc/manganese transport system permease protein